MPHRPHRPPQKALAQLPCNVKKQAQNECQKRNHNAPQGSWLPYTACQDISPRSLGAPLVDLTMQREKSGIYDKIAGFIGFAA